MEDAGMLTLLFLGVLTLLGKVLFRVEDWGKPRKPHSGIVHGEYLPRIYLRKRPIGKVRMGEYRKFHERHGRPDTKSPRD